MQHFSFKLHASIGLVGRPAPVQHCHPATIPSRGGPQINGERVFNVEAVEKGKRSSGAAVNGSECGAYSIRECVQRREAAQTAQNERSRSKENR
jgi:hypothetical protein